MTDFSSVYYPHANNYKPVNNTETNVQANFNPYQTSQTNELSSNDFADTFTPSAISTTKQPNTPPNTQPFYATNTGDFQPYIPARQYTQGIQQPATTTAHLASYNDPLKLNPNQTGLLSKPSVTELPTWEDTTNVFDRENLSGVLAPYENPSPISDIPRMKSPSWLVMANGLKAQDLLEGYGAPVKPGDKLTVEYVGRLKDTGEIFDQSHPDRPFSFTVGAGEVIEGWDMGILGNNELKAMLPGGKRILEIPSELAYGEAGAGDKIPPGATLVFEVALKKVN